MANRKSEISTAGMSRERLNDTRLWLGLQAEMGLSDRERDVAIRLVLGDSIRQIAGRLGISPHTVCTYVGRLRVKTGVRHRGELVTQLLLASGLLLGEGGREGPD